VAELRAAERRAQDLCRELVRVREALAPVEPPLDTVGCLALVAAVFALAPVCRVISAARLSHGRSRSEVGA
jgi:hypothetical protein